MTENDIRQYATERLIEHERMQKLSRSEPGDTAEVSLTHQRSQMLLTYWTQVVRIVRETSALPRTYALAAQHAQKARDALQVLPSTPARDALEALTMKVLSRDQ